MSDSYLLLTCASSELANVLTKLAGLNVMPFASLEALRVFATDDDNVSQPDEPATSPTLSDGQTLGDAMRAYERQLVADAVKRNGHHRNKTAAELGISRVTLHNKLKSLGLADEWL